MPLLRRTPLVSVVVPVYDVADYLPACLDSLLAQKHRALEIVVVDDGSTDGSGDLAEQYAARDPRVRVEHVPNGGLGAARNIGVGLARGEYLGFADSDDVVRPEAIGTLLKAVRKGADFATGNVVRLEGETTTPIGWMDRLHTAYVGGVEGRPELLGDVFAWNKLFRRDFWDRLGLSWPERVRYEDQPTTTEAFVRAETVAVLPEVVYRWRIRGDGSAITEQRASTDDLRDRWRTKRMSLETVRAHGSPDLARVFLDKTLPGDMWRYFVLIPEAGDEWWRLLVEMVRDLWGEQPFADSDLAPVHRLTGWLVGQDRREDARLVIEHLRSLDGQPVRRVPGPDGPMLEVPGLSDVPVQVLTVRS